MSRVMTPDLPIPHLPARKRRITVTAAFAAERETIATLEGPVVADTGDAIVTADSGEVWPVARAIFERRYEALPPTVMGEAGQYRSLPWSVRVVQFDRAASVPVSGGRSRLTGKPGDWLVDYGDGTLGVIAPAIFAATYELEDPAGKDGLQNP